MPGGDGAPRPELFPDDWLHLRLEGKRLGGHQSMCTNKKPVKRISLYGFKVSAGNDLLSHAVSHAVPSALKGLTAVFGMVTGVSPSL